MIRNKTLFIIFVILLVTSFITGCAATPKTGGVYHVVKKGETLWRIARAYDTTPTEIAEANNLPDTTIEAGGVLFIPHATEPIDITTPGAPAEISVPAATQKYTLREEDLGPTREEKQPAASAPSPKTALTSAQEKPTPPAAPEKTASAPSSKISKDRFIWPIDGSISSKFGVYKGMRYNGIKIDAPEGTPVRSAADGIVTYADSMKYFGETIIIKHNDIYSTVYSQLKERKVRPGATVKQGDIIGLLGKGDDGKSCLYFEIRRNNGARDPLRYLPKKK